MKSHLISALLLFTVSAFAQPGPDTLWTRTWGWALNDTAFSLQRTIDGGFIFAGTATALGTRPRTKIFLIKADSLGIVQAWHAYGDSMNYGAYSVVQTMDSGYAVAGYVGDSAGYMYAGYCLKVNAFGDTVWSYQPSTSVFGPGVASGILEADDGGLVIAFHVAPTLMFNPFAAIDKVSSDGGHLWHWGVESASGIRSRGLRRLTDGSFVFTGAVTRQTGTQAFLEHISPQGAFLYGNSFYGDSNYTDAASDIVEIPNGYLMAGATSDGHLDGLLLCKCNDSFVPLWVHRNLGEYAGWAYAMTPAIGGGAVVAGTAPNYAGNFDMYLAKVNDAGEIVWQRNYGGDGDQVAYDVIQTPDGGFVLVGYTNASTANAADWFIVKTRPDPELTSGENPILHPSSFRLSAFPNPFNPATTISFDLPETQRVQLTIYDLQGRTIAMLLNEPVTAGTHTVSFDGSHMPSGLYFARVQAGRFIATQKLLLLK